MNPTFTQRFCVLLLAAVVFACGDDDSNSILSDSENPIVKLTAPVGEGVLYGTVHVTAIAEDNDEITKLSVFIDNATTPAIEVATASVDFAWDTRTLADGNHTLRVVATDNSDNVGDVKATVTIRNTLLSLYVPVDYIPQSQVEYIVISDEKGTVLDSKQVTNNSTYTFLVPEGFTGQNLTMTAFVRELFDGRYNYNYVYTYANVPFGNYAYRARTSSSSTKKGDATITITDARFEDNIDQAFSGRGYFSYGEFSDGKFEMGIELYADKVPTLLQSYTSGDFLYHYSELVPGGVYSYSFNDFLRADTRPITVPTTGEITLSISGTNAAGTFKYIRGVQMERTGSTIQAPVPALNFTSIATSIRAANGGESFGYDFVGADVPVGFKQIDGELSYTRKENTITINKDANADYIWFDAQTDVTEDPYNYSFWSVYASPEAGTVTLPQLPKILVDTYSAPVFSTMVDTYGLYTRQIDEKGFTGFRDYLDYNFNPQTTIPASPETLHRSKTFEKGSHDGGRKAFGAQEGREVSQRPRR